MQTELIDTAVHCAHDDMVPTADLKPNPRNPNKHPEKQIVLLAKIIQTQGWRAPITVSNRSGLIVRGYCRLEAAKLAGLTECPVDRQDYDSDEAEYSDMLADNKIAELAETDFASLADLLLELDAANADLALTGFDQSEIESIMTWTPGGVEEVTPPVGWKESDENIEIAYCCPKCGYEWSGKPNVDG